MDMGGISFIYLHAYSCESQVSYEVECHKCHIGHIKYKDQVQFYTKGQELRNFILTYRYINRVFFCTLFKVHTTPETLQ